MNTPRAAPLAAVLALALATLASPALAGVPAGAPADCASFCPSVRTSSGRVVPVRGGLRVRPERGGASFTAFLGVPYAEPPVGGRRFKSPEPPVFAGDETIDAVQDPPMCPQINTNSVAKEVIGNEDCLYLNVYVPDVVTRGTSSTQLLPVLFLVHGGTFDHGSGRLEEFGPHFLLRSDVIVVSINYRLGVLGFVSLDNEQIPGNAGLKDIVMALKWVQDNIRSFGGDSSQVTALGWSTGASAVHLLSLLPASRGLFSRAVLIAGHAVSPRAYTERHLERARGLAHILGAKDNETDTVVRALREADAERLLRASDDPRMRRLGLPLPSPERRDCGGQPCRDPKLVIRDPESLLRQPAVPPMPVMLSVAAREGSLPFVKWGLDAQSPEAVDALLPRLMPADLLPGADTAALLGSVPGPGPGPLAGDAALRLAQLVRREYSGGRPIANDTDRLVEFLGDAFLYASTWRAVELMARNSWNSSEDAASLHLYRFAVDNSWNYVKKLYGITLAGASHVDELGYLGRFDRLPDLRQDVSGDSNDKVAARTLLRMVKMITDFAKGSRPCWPAVPSGASDPHSWPIRTVDAAGSCRADHVDTLAPHHAFWTAVYGDLRARTASIGRT